jgi:UDP-N-acetylglucosamine transferase subunit ALG13
VIFVTVGTQLPFDRLVRAVDLWAKETGRDDVVAQVGPHGYRPEHIGYRDFMTAGEFREHMQRAEAIVAHAGIGTIISALELGKPLLVMPRKAELGEQRNNHQLATARRFADLGRVHVAWCEREVAKRMDELHRLSHGERIGSHASASLIEAVRQFVTGSPEAPLPAPKVETRRVKLVPLEHHEHV